MANQVTIPFKFDFSDSGINDLLKVLTDIKNAGNGAFSDFAKSALDSFSQVDKKAKDLKETLGSLDDAKSISGIADELDLLSKAQAKNIKQAIDFVGAFKDQQSAIAGVDAEIRKLNSDTKTLQKQQDLLIAANQQESEAYSELSSRIAENQVKTKTLAEEKKKITSIMDREIKAAVATKGSYNELAAATNLLVARAKNFVVGIDGTEKELAKLQARVHKNTQELKDFDAKLNQNFRNVGNYKDGVGAAAGITSQFGGTVGVVGNSLGNLQGGLGAVKTGFGSLKAAIASTGIGLFLLILVPVIKYLSKLDPLLDAIEQGFAAVGAAMDVVGGFFVSIFTGDPSGSFGDLAENIEKAAVAAANLKAAQQDLADQMKIQEVANAKASQQVSELRLQARNKSIDAGKSIELLRKAEKIEEENFKQRDFNARKELRNAQEAARIKGQLSKKELADLEERGTAAAIDLQNKGKLSDEEVDLIQNAELAIVEIKKESTDKRTKIQNEEDAKLEKQQAAREKAVQEGERMQQKTDEAFKKSLQTRLDTLASSIQEEKNVIKQRFADGTINEEQFQQQTQAVEQKALDQRQMIFKNYLEETNKNSRISGEVKKEIQADVQKKIQESESAILDFQINVNKQKVDDFKKLADDRLKLVADDFQKQELAIKTQLAQGLIDQEEADRQITQLKLDNAAKASAELKAVNDKALADQTLNANTRAEIEKEAGVKSIEIQSELIDATIANNEKKKELARKGVDDDIKQQQKETDFVLEQAKTEILNSKLSEEKKKEALEELNRQTIDFKIELKQQEIDALKAIGEDSIDQEIELEKLKQQKLSEAQKGGLQERLKEGRDFAKQALDNAFESAKKQSEEREKGIDKELSDSEKAVDFQRQLAAEGKENTLAFELEKQQELEKLKLQEQKKQERLQKIQTFYEFFKTFASEGKGAAIAAAKAGAAIKIGEVIAAKLEGGTHGTLEDEMRRQAKGSYGGVNSMGITYGKQHSQGGTLIEMEPGEGMLSKREMRNIGLSRFLQIKKMAGMGTIGNALIGQNESMNIVRTQVADPNTGRFADAIEDLKRSWESKPVVYQRLNTLGDFVEETVHKGYTKLKTQKRRSLGGYRNA